MEDSRYLLRSKRTGMKDTEVEGFHDAFSDRTKKKKTQCDTTNN